MGNIAQGHGQEGNTARVEAECYICLGTTHAYVQFFPHIVHEHKQYLTSCTCVLYFSQEINSTRNSAPYMEIKALFSSLSTYNKFIDCLQLRVL